MKVNELIDALKEFNLDAEVKIENNLFDKFEIEKVYMDTTDIKDDKFVISIQTK